MTADRLIRKELLALLRGGNAHMEFNEVLDRLTIDDINRKAPNVPYSFWHILEHMRITQWDILEFIRDPGHVSPHYPGGYRPRPEQKADRAQWKKTISGFRSDMKALERMIEDPHTDLFGPLPHAHAYTIFREILLAADHNAYHMGELAMLRQVMDLWPADNQYLTGTDD